jgi:hypothetical protein
MKKRIKVRELAEEAGVIIFKCGKEWGGEFAYKTKNCNAAVCGYKTEKALYKNWFETQSNQNFVKALVKLSGSKIVFD